MSRATSRRHVVILTYGEPPLPEFFAQLKYSWRILLGLTRSVAPIPAAALPMIALSRGRMRVKLWSDERFESPLEPLTLDQQRGLGQALARVAPEVDWQVHVAYEFRDPLLTRLIASLPDDEPVQVLPMYVADSAFTHELSRQTLAAWVARRGGRRAPVTVMPPLDPAVVADLSAAHVVRALAARGIAPGKDWALVLAAHGTLLAPPRPYETGRVATEELSCAIAGRLPQFASVGLGWLNHVYGGRWTEPPADVALARIAESGVKKVVYYPFGFYADNAESLLEGRLALRTQPQLEHVHLPCLNDDPGLMEAFARQLAAHAAEGSRAA